MDFLSESIKLVRDVFVFMREHYWKLCRVFLSYSPIFFLHIVLSMLLGNREQANNMEEIITRLCSPKVILMGSFKSVLIFILGLAVFLNILSLIREKKTRINQIYGFLFSKRCFFIGLLFFFESILGFSFPFLYCFIKYLGFSTLLTLLLLVPFLLFYFYFVLRFFFVTALFADKKVSLIDSFIISSKATSESGIFRTLLIAHFFSLLLVLLGLILLVGSGIIFWLISPVLGVFVGICLSIVSIPLLSVMYIIEGFAYERFCLSKMD